MRLFFTSTCTLDVISTSPFMLITLQFFSNNPPPPSPSPTPDCSRSSISKTIPTSAEIQLLLVTKPCKNLEFLAEPYFQDQVTNFRILAMAAVHPPTDSLVKQNILKCAMLASEFSNLSWRNFLHIELPGRNSTLGLLLDWENLGKTFNSWRNHILGPSYMYIAFQGRGYGCCASTYRFITQTDYSDGAMLASEFLVI